MKPSWLRACVVALSFVAVSAARADVAREGANPSVYIVTSQATHAGIAAFVHEAQYRRDGAGETLVIARVDAGDVDALSRYVHENEKRCGGFFAFDTLREAEDFLARDHGTWTIGQPTGLAYTIDNHATVDPWLPQVLETNIHDTIQTLSAFRNRYYSSTYGKQAAESIRDLWLALAADRSDVDIELFTGCTNCSTQPSVIMTLHGKERAGEVVVIGGHLDSININSGGSQQIAPGADDDASGIATITEVARIALAGDWRPQRTIKFMGYAAEEVGLRGSNAIATKFANDHVDVVGVLQLDMTNYKDGAPYDMQRITDYADASLNAWFGDLFAAYLAPLGFVLSDFPCGYGCSDHASWTAKGFPAGLMFEAGRTRDPNDPNDFGDFPYIHTTADTLANMGDSAAHSVKFAQFGLAFIGELGKTHDTSIAPVAGFGYAVDGMDVQFTDASGDANGLVVARTWDFGDGTTSSETNPLKTYASVGSHAVTLTVTDDDGMQDTHVENVIVDNDRIFGNGFEG